MTRAIECHLRPGAAAAAAVATAQETDTLTPDELDPQQQQQQHELDAAAEAALGGDGGVVSTSRQMTKRTTTTKPKAPLKGKARKTKGANSTEKCELCKSEQAALEYSQFLFSNASRDAAAAATSRRRGGALVTAASYLSNNEAESEDEEQQQQQARIMFHPSDMEHLLRLIALLCRRRDHSASASTATATATASLTFSDEDARFSKSLGDLYATLKDEYHAARAFWTCVCNQVGSRDNLAMSKERVQLAPAGVQASELTKCPHLIERSLKHIDAKISEHSTQMSTAQLELKRKLGQLVYLQHTLRKATGGSTAAIADVEEAMTKAVDAAQSVEVDKEPCPICQCELGNKWYLLVCGHTYCCECFAALCRNTDGLRAQRVLCALCRHLSKRSEASLVGIAEQSLVESPSSPPPPATTSSKATEQGKATY